MTSPLDSALTRRVIGCSIDVHRHLGPGLLESVYEACLCDELTVAGPAFVRQCSLPSKYPPAKPGALECWPLKAAGQVADAACEV